jgi:hypothetical protein
VSLDCFDGLWQEEDLELPETAFMCIYATTASSMNIATHYRDDLESAVQVATEFMGSVADKRVTMFTCQWPVSLDRRICVIAPWPCMLTRINLHTSCLPCTLQSAGRHLNML